MTKVIRPWTRSALMDVLVPTGFERRYVTVRRRWPFWKWGAMSKWASPAELAVVYKDAKGAEMEVSGYSICDGNPCRCNGTNGPPLYWDAYRTDDARADAWNALLEVFDD